MASNYYLERFIDGPVIQGDIELGALLREADDLPDAVMYMPNFYDFTTAYAGEHLIDLIGVSHHEYIKEGFKVIRDTTVEQDLPRLMAQQSMYMQQVAQPDFDLRTPLVQHYRWTARWPSGKLVPVQGTGIVLTFTDRKEFKMGVGFALLDRPESTRALAACQAMVVRIKERHNAVYQHVVAPQHDVPFVHQYTDDLSLQITLREREILACLGRGLSTRVAASLLKISEHTVESHRKNLLQKFEARNTAELIKKASKVFWLE